MSLVLAVSPHLDDAAFSAGAALATWSKAGHDVVVCTVFTQSVPEPAGFALACQTEKGLGPEVDYMDLRRMEDANACERLGAEPVWLDFREAPHRGYESAGALFSEPHDLETADEIEKSLHDRFGAKPPDLVLSCQGLGGHVDHRVVIQAVAAFTEAAGLAVAWWADQPYALRQPDAHPAPELSEGLSHTVVSAGSAARAAKLDACAAYVSQLPYQFGRDAPDNAQSDPEAAMRNRLGDCRERFVGRLSALDVLHRSTP